MWPFSIAMVQFLLWQMSQDDPFDVKSMYNNKPSHQADFWPKGMARQRSHSAYS